MQIRAFATMFWRAVREARRIVVVVIAVPLVVPIFMLTVFSRVFTAIVEVPGFQGGESYVQYIAPGAIMMAVMLSGTAAVSVSVERQSGFYDRMRIAPMGPRWSNLARRIADSVKLLAFAFVLVIVSWLSGAPIRDWALVLTLGTVLPALWGFAYGGIAFAACLRTGRAEVENALFPLFFPLLFMSSAFVPPILMPDWLAQIARYNPLTFLSDAIRGAYMGRVDLEPLTLALISVLLLTALTQAFVVSAERSILRS